MLGKKEIGRDRVWDREREPLAISPAFFAILPSFTTSLISPPASLSGSSCTPFSLSFFLPNLHTETPCFLPLPLSTCLLPSLPLPFTQRRRARKAKAKDGGCGGSGGGCVHFLLWTRQKGGKDSKKSGVGVDREAKEDRDRDFYLHPCESYSVPGWRHVGRTLFYQLLVPEIQGRFRIKTSCLNQNTEASSTTWLTEWLDWSGQSLSLCSLALAFQN